MYSYSNLSQQQIQTLIVIGTISSLDEASLCDAEERIDHFLSDYLEKRTNIIVGREDGIYLASIGSTQQEEANNTTRIDLEFNPHPKNWPYDWSSHRFRKSTNHAFIINVFELTNHKSSSSTSTRSFQRLERYHGPTFSLASKRRGHGSQAAAATTSGRKMIGQVIRKNSMTSISDETTSDDSSDEESGLILKLLQPPSSATAMNYLKEEVTPHLNLGLQSSSVETTTPPSKARRSLAQRKHSLAKKISVSASNLPQPSIEPMSTAEYLLNHAWLPSPWAIRHGRHDNIAFKFDDPMLDDKEKALLDILDDSRLADGQQLAFCNRVQTKIMVDHPSSESSAAERSTLPKRSYHGADTSSSSLSSSSAEKKRARPALFMNTSCNDDCGSVDAAAWNILDQVPITSRKVITTAEIKTVLHDLEKLKELIELQLD
jgi:hypothetical protein